LAAGIHYDITVWIRVPHTLAPQVMAMVSRLVCNLLRNLQIAKHHLGIGTMSRQNKKHIVADPGATPQIVPADSPSRGLSPEMGIVINPRTDAPAFGWVYGMKISRDVYEPLH
jgi:hypothetical protein